MKKHHIKISVLSKTQSQAPIPIFAHVPYLHTENELKINNNNVDEPVDLSTS